MKRRAPLLLAQESVRQAPNCFRLLLGEDVSVLLQCKGNAPMAETHRDHMGGHAGKEQEDGVGMSEIVVSDPGQAGVSNETIDRWDTTSVSNLCQTNWGEQTPNHPDAPGWEPTKTPMNRGLADPLPPPRTSSHNSQPEGRRFKSFPRYQELQSEVWRCSCRRLE